MKRKIQKTYVYDGLGFPIRLMNVPMVEIDGNWEIHVNLNELQKIVLLMLCHKPTPLTGNEVSFIRKYFAMTTTAFGSLLGITFGAVLKWEKRKNMIALITPTTEQVIRLKVLQFLHSNATEFKKLCEKIELMKLAKYQERKNMRYTPISINAKSEELRVA